MIQMCVREGRAHFGRVFRVAFESVCQDPKRVRIGRLRPLFTFLKAGAKYITEARLENMRDEKSVQNSEETFTEKQKCVIHLTRIMGMVQS